MTQTSSTRVLFVHHSTGGDMIKHGKVRHLFKKLAPDIAFWDHGYDPDKITGYLHITSLFQPHIYGLRDGAGKLLSKSFHIPNHNTDPDGLATLFSQTVTNPPTNALSHILEFDVIVFKSCFPVTRISTDTQLRTYQAHYCTIRDAVDKHPNKLFISMTPPPLRLSLTDREKASRAREFAQWMKSETFLENRTHLIVFDYFDVLANPPSSASPNVLRSEFCSPIWLDSHPNKFAHQTVAPQWVEFIANATQIFFSSPSRRRKTSERI